MKYIEYAMAAIIGAVLKNAGSILYRVDNLPYQRQRYPHGCFVYGACVVRKEHVHAGTPEA